MKKAIAFTISSFVFLLLSIFICSYEMYTAHKLYSTLHVPEMQAENARIGAKVDAIYKKVQAHEERLKDVKSTVSRAEDVISRARKVRVEITAYTCSPADCGKAVGSPGYGHCASGYILTQADAWKVIAVDPKFIPIGTSVFIPGVGIAVARDTGGAIKRNIIDLFVSMADTKIADKWGRRTMDIYILED